MLILPLQQSYILTCTDIYQARKLSLSQQRKLALTFADWPICLQKVWLQIDLKQVASNPFYCVIYWEDVDPLSILHIRAWLNAVEDIRLDATSVF